MKKVVIVGAGPAGLFAAYELSKQNLDITLIDAGKSIENRKCYAGMLSTECRKCKPCSITHGIGGAGLFSDGKLIFHTVTGNNLSEIIKEEENQNLVNEVENIFTNYGIIAKNINENKAMEMETKANQLGMEYIHSKQAHVGSDRLPKKLEEIVNSLKDKIKIITGESAKEISGNKLICSKNEYEFTDLILATGRAENKWIQETADKNKLNYLYNPVDIGVRIEVPDSIMREFYEINWDFKIRMVTEKYQDKLRTFCVCPKGFVVKEDYGDFCLVNGNSKKNEQSENTNFALLVHFPLKDPVKNGNEVGAMIAKKITYYGGGKPLMQRLGDIRRGRRTTEQRNNYYKIPKPTLEDVTCGDITSAFAYRYVCDILEGLEKLDKLIPGVAQDSTILYCPEIKFHGIKFITDNYLQTNVKGIYVAGDGSGYSRGIVGAAASGLLAAKGILRE